MLSLVRWFWLQNMLFCDFVWLCLIVVLFLAFVLELLFGIEVCTSCYSSDLFLNLVSLYNLFASHVLIVDLGFLVRILLNLSRVALYYVRNSYVFSL
ncbi:hypothetical protein Hdeb2414_s0015g00437681 [Helianthus debilis subsp. tardiflorus]